MSPKKEAISDAALGKRVYAAYMRDQGKTYKEIAERFNATSSTYGQFLVRGHRSKMLSVVQNLRPLKNVLEMLAKTPEPMNEKELSNGHAQLPL
jgi:hypothetical protein